MSTSETPFFQAGGTLSADAPSYVERSADQELLKALNRGEYCLILAPRQSGKSSMMVHSAEQLKQQGMHVGIADFQHLGDENNPERWFSDVLHQLGRGLALKTNSVKWWKNQTDLGVNQRFIHFLESVVLEECQGEIVLFFDEIDSLIALPFSDDFFTTLRAVYNARATNPDLKRIRMVLLGLAAPSDFVKDRARTPFNIGTSIELTDFDATETQTFQAVLGVNAQPIIERIFYWTDGQPFLVQQLANSASSWQPEDKTSKKIDQQVEQVYFQGKIESNGHLKFIRDYLLRDESLLRKTLKTYLNLLMSRELPLNEQSIVQNRLKLAGVAGIDKHKLKPRNRIYQTVFDQVWVKEHLPHDFQKWTTIGLSFFFFSLFIWAFLVQPLVFPTFPNIPPMIRYRAESSFNERVSLEGSNVCRAELNGQAIPLEEECRFFSQNEGVEFTLSSLPMGESTHHLKLYGGAFNQFREYPIQVTYYPGWEMQQFPDKRLNLLPPIVEIYGNNFQAKRATNGLVLGEFNGHVGPVNQVVVFSDEKRYLSASEDGTLRLWEIVNTSEGEEIRTLHTMQGHQKGVLHVALSPDEKTILSTSRDHTLILWDVVSGRIINRFHGHQEAVNDVVFSRDGRKAVSASDDQSLILWDVLTGIPEKTFPGENGAILSVALGTDNRILSGTAEGTIQIWDLSTGKIINTLQGHQKAVTSLAISPNSQLFLSGSNDQTMRLWDLKTGTVLHVFQPFEASLNEVSFMAGEQLLSATLKTGTTMFFEQNHYEKIPLFQGHQRWVTSVFLISNDQKLVSWGADNFVKLWDTQTGKLIHEFQASNSISTTAAMSKNEQFIFIGNTIGIEKWDVIHKKQIWKTAIEGSRVWSLVLSPNEKRIILANVYQPFRVIDTETGKIIDSFGSDHAQFLSIDLANNGTTLIVGDGDNKITLWEANSWKMLNELELSSGVWSVSFSPDGEKFVTGEDNGSLTLWNTDPVKKLSELKGHKTIIVAFTFSPDGKILASQESDGTIILWDITTKSALRTFKANKSNLRNLAFSSDGNTLFSGSLEGTITRWWAAFEPKATDTQPQ